jgi:hypothetical protein
VRRTSGSDLAIPFLVVAALMYVLLRVTYENLPPFRWFVAVPIAVLAIVEFAIARRVRMAVRHNPQAKPMRAISIARAVALGKASALAGAAIAGAAAGLIVKVLPDSWRTRAAPHDLRVGLVIVAVSALLVVTGLLLERAGVDPGRDGRGR